MYEVWSHSSHKVLIIGYGNSLRSDDGVGTAVAKSLAEQFCDNPAVRVIVAAQLTPEMAPDLADVEHVLFIDAAAEGAPGTIRKAPVTADQAVELQTHHCTPATLLFFAERLYGSAPAAMLLTISAASFEPGSYLSPAVQGRVPQVVESARLSVQEWCGTSSSSQPASNPNR